ncbi:glutathione hydrolase 1 proenzyme-like [Anneissia japonica]|uniref:glutathione hydrolase 1 proenzyme-like n=1 Tax=Anneissia japonica TaxID=1529436 RepID=UPI0014259235|nr:glutathione hydrolase 1 proenzyme-like [Anneissia japonica]
MADVEFENKPRKNEKKQSRVKIIVLMVLLLVIIVVTLVLVFSLTKKENVENGQFRKAAVATDVPECSEMGSSILQGGGSAVDSAITSMLCVGLVHGQSSGIGGGSFWLIYDRKAKGTKFINARETSPAATTPDMFNSDPKTKVYGALAIGTPGELKGMWEAHQKYGKLSWKELFQPVIALARKGFRVTNHTVLTLNSLVASGFVSDAWRDVYFKDNGTHPKEYGDIVIRSNFADTLQRIANIGVSEFYTGHTADMIMQDMNTYNGTLSMADLSNYSVKWSDVLTTSFMGYSVMSPSMPSGGPIYQFIINVMKGFDIDISSDADKVKFFHRFLETCKLAFGLRAYLGDVDTPEVNQVLNNLASENYARKIRDTISDDMVSYANASYYSTRHDDTNDKLGDTSHVSVLAANGDAVSVTTTVNWYFGCKIMSPTTGLIYNNEMADFTIPNTEDENQPSNPANYPAPYKHPLSSMSGSILLDENGDVKLVIGSSGGKKIITANAWVTLIALATNLSITDAIEIRRIHNQLFPNEGMYEAGFSTAVLERLEDLGQVVREKSSFAVVQAILTDENGIDAYADSRKQGKAVIY